MRFGSTLLFVASTLPFVMPKAAAHDRMVVVPASKSARATVGSFPEPIRLMQSIRDELCDGRLDRLHDDSAGRLQAIVGPYEITEHSVHGPGDEDEQRRTLVWNLGPLPVLAADGMPYVGIPCLQYGSVVWDHVGDPRRLTVTLEAHPTVACGLDRRLIENALGKPDASSAIQVIPLHAAPADARNEQTIMTYKCHHRSDRRRTVDFGIWNVSGLVSWISSRR